MQGRVQVLVRFCLPRRGTVFEAVVGLLTFQPLLKHFVTQVLKGAV